MNPVSIRMLSQQLASPVFSLPEEVVAHLGAVQARRHGAPPPLPINLDCRHCTMCPTGK